MASIFEITDGTITVNLISDNFGFHLSNWRQNVIDIKGGGVYQNSSISEGQRLVFGRFDNGYENLTLKANNINQDALIADGRKLLQLLEKARNYWLDDNQNEPVYIKSKASNESETRYSIIVNYRLPEFPNPFNSPFLQPNCLAVYDDFDLVLERKHWLQFAPGTGEYLKLSDYTNYYYNYLWNKIEWINGNGYNVLDVGEATKYYTPHRFKAYDNGISFDVVCERDFVNTLNTAYEVKIFTPSWLPFPYLVWAVGGGNIHQAAGISWSIGGTYSAGIYPVLSLLETDNGNVFIIGGNGISSTPSGVISFSILYNTSYTCDYRGAIQLSTGRILIGDNNHLLKSDDYTNFEPFGNNLNGEIWDIVELDNGNILAVANDSVQSILYLSTDEGDNWSVYNNVLNINRMIKLNDGSLCANDIDGTGVFLSTDNGVTWIKQVEGNGETPNTLYQYKNPSSSYDLGSPHYAFSGLAYEIENCQNWSNDSNTYATKTRLEWTASYGLDDSNFLYISNKYQPHNINFLFEGTSSTDYDPTYPIKSETEILSYTIPGAYLMHPTITDYITVYGYTSSGGSSIDLFHDPSYPFDNIIIKIKNPTNEAQFTTFDYTYPTSVDGTYQPLTFGTLTIYDKTNLFSSINWGNVSYQLPDDWVSGDAMYGRTPTAIGKFIEFDWTGAFSANHDPTTEVNIFTANKPYIDINNIVGDIPALCKIRVFNVSDDENNTTGLNFSRCIIGSKNNNNFLGFLNADNLHIKPGITVTSTGSFNTYSRSHTGVTADNSVTWSINDGIAKDFYGTYRVFARLDQSAGVDTTYFNVSANFGEELDIFTSRNVYLKTTNEFQLLDFGSLTISNDNKTPQELNITLNVNDKTGTLRIYDLILIPTDNYSVDCYSNNNSKITDGYYLEINGLNDKTGLRAIKGTGVNTKISDYQIIGSEFYLEDDTRLWSLCAAYGANNEWISYPFILNKFEINVNNRYISSRGNS